MAGEVVQLREGTALPGQPDEALVALLERLLEDARSGDLRAIAYATVRAGGAVGTGWDGGRGTRDPLSTAISILGVRYPLAVLEER